MTDEKYTILQSWPRLKEDLKKFLSDTDAWIISELIEACADKNWQKVLGVIEIMELVHNISHSH